MSISSSSSSQNLEEQSESVSRINKDRFSFVENRLDKSKSKYFINLDDYENTDSPEKGSFGYVHFVKKKSTGKLYATKTSYYECNSKHFFYILREMSALLNIQHPTILSIEGYSFTENHKLTILMNYEEKGSLANLLRSDFPSDYDNTKRQIILVGIARAMKFLHKQNVIHRDLKPENVLLDKNYNPHVADFSISKLFNLYNLRNNNTPLNIRTFAYMAPEVLKSHKYSYKSDVYSFGIIMYEILSGKRAYDSLFENNEFKILEFKKKIINENCRPTIDFEIKKGFRQMIEKCLSKNPRERPTFDELFNKLSNQENGDVLDFDDNYYEPSIKDDDSDDLSLNKYIIDGVDEEKLYQYVDSIFNDNALNFEYAQEMQRLVEIAKKLDIEYIPNIIANNSELEEEITKLYEIILNKVGIQELREKRISDIHTISVILRKYEIPTYFHTIPEKMFQEFGKLKKILIPTSVTSIESYAFSGCKSLVEINIPDTVTSMGTNIFEKCISLKSIKIPSKITTIPKSTFSECESLENVEIPSSVTIIDNSCFSGCSSLVSIDLPSSLTEIQEDAFNNCKSLKSIEIPPNVTVINICCFDSCKSLTNITIHPGITTIPYGTFRNSSLVSIEIPESVTKIGSYAFENCRSLKSVTIPESVTEIEYYAFKNCRSLKSVTIPESVTEIGSNCFAKCKSLEKVEILASIKTIEYDTFEDCFSLKSVTIPSTVTEIKSNAFSNCRSLQNIEIPSSVTSIHDDAFYECSGLKQITVPRSLDIKSLNIGSYLEEKKITSIDVKFI